MSILKKTSVCVCLFILSILCLTFSKLEIEAAGPESAEVSHINKNILSIITDANSLLRIDAPPAISSNGKNIAWTVRKKPAHTYTDPSQGDDINVHALVMGSQIWIKEGDNHPVEMMPEKSCWGPSWSPNGDKLAQV